MKKMGVKQLRLIIGIGMMYCFLSLAFVIYLSVNLALSHGIMVLNTWMLWFPNIAFIWLSYHVLTKVYPYKGVQNKLSAKKEENVVGGEERNGDFRK